MTHTNTSNCLNCQNEDKTKCECYTCLKKHHDLMHDTHAGLVEALKEAKESLIDRDLKALVGKTNAIRTINAALKDAGEL
jgi:hypothetical protein